MSFPDVFSKITYSLSMSDLKELHLIRIVSNYNFCKLISHTQKTILIFFTGSVFLERDLLMHQTFGQIFETLNDDENYLNGTRVDYNIQYSDLDQFDAYQKACMEMTYR